MTQNPHRFHLFQGGARCICCGDVWMAEPSKTCPGEPQPRWYESIPLPEGEDQHATSQGYLDVQPDKKSWYFCIRCGSRFIRPHPDRLCRQCAAELPRRFQHEEAVAWARARLASPLWRLMNIEVRGVGLLAEMTRIVILNHKGEVLFNSPVRPIHCDLDDPQFKQMPAFSRIYPKLVELLSSQSVIAYNASAHAFLIERSCQQHNLPLFPMDWACAMMWYARYYGEWNPYQKGFQWQPLGRGGNAVETGRNVLDLLRDMAAERTPWLSQERRRR